MITAKDLRDAKVSGNIPILALNKASMEAKLEKLAEEIKNCQDPKKRKELEREYQEDMKALKEVQ